MWIALDSGWMDHAQDLFVRLRSNLPLAIATTIVMSLLVAFWRNVLRFFRRRLGLVEPPKEPLQPYLPEGDVAHALAPGKFCHGFTVHWGWRGAVIDAGVVQQELEPRRYRRRTMARMSARMGLSEDARVVVWRDREFPVHLYLDDLFARDHQPMRLEIRCLFRINPARLMQSSIEEIMLPPAKISEHISSKISLAAQRWVSSMEAREFYDRQDRRAQWSASAMEWVQNALADSPFQALRITGLQISSPALDQVYRDYGELALENETARREIERNKVRGALRQAALAGKLAEIRDEQQHEDAIRMIEQERSLKEKTLRQELEQAELSELENKVRVWRRKQEILLQMLDPAMAEAGVAGAGAPDPARRVLDSFRRRAVDNVDSPFSAQERERIRRLLREPHGAKPEEILSAVARETDIPQAMFDPLTRIRGSHTLRVGDGWRIFDGASLWQIRLTRIKTQRQGFLWRHESPSQAHFEIRASPSNRRYEQEVALGKPFRLTVGSNTIPAQYLGGTPSRISLRIV